MRILGFYLGFLRGTVVSQNVKKLTALGNCFCLENQSTEKLLTCILQQIVDVNGYKCHSNFLTVVSNR